MGWNDTKIISKIEFDHDCTKRSHDLIASIVHAITSHNETTTIWNATETTMSLKSKFFLSTVRSYDKHDKCGLVWIPRVVAYRCRTCGISPCMSICRECFHRGDHSTHDFNMFLSQAGGACDCGDNSVMKEDG